MSEQTEIFQQRMTKTNTFKLVKSAYARGRNWHDDRLMFGPCSVNEIAKTLTIFAPFLLTCYNCLFVETQYGVALVTCVSHQGIRIEYFFGSKDRGYEWLTFNNGQFLGDAGTVRELTPQPQAL